MIHKGSEKPKLLVVAPRSPFPLVGGDRLRVFHLCRVLSKDFDIYLLCLTDEASAIDPMSHPEAKYFCSIQLHYLPKWKSLLKTLLGLFNPFPMQVNFYWDKQFARKIENLSAEHDACLFHLIRTARYGAYCAKKPLKILEMTDAISRNYSAMGDSKGFFSLRKFIFIYEKRKLQHYEKQAVNAFDVTTLVSKIDIDYLKNLCDERPPTDKIIYIPNGISIDSYHYKSQWTHNNVIGFVGNITSLQNFDACFYFASEILPRLQEIGPYVFKVIGRIGNREKSSLEKFPNVLVTGEVDSIQDELADASIGVCPVRVSAGIQNKVLEYLALGLPAIVTSKSVVALGLTDGEEVLVADSPDEYLQQFIALKDNDDLCHALRTKGRQHVESHYDWHTNIGLLSKRMTDALNG